jgi:integrase/recombinase XerD
MTIYLGHDDIAITQIYAVTSVAALRRKFDQVTDPSGQALITEIQ